MFSIVVQLFSHKDGQFSPSSRFRNSSGYFFYFVELFFALPILPLFRHFA